MLTRKNRLKTSTHRWVDDSTTASLVDEIGRSEWFFLSRVAKNLEPRVFAELLKEIDKKIKEDHQRNGTAPNKHHHLENAEKGGKDD